MGEIRVKPVNATDEKLDRRPLMIIHDACIHYGAIVLRAFRFIINVFSVILSDRAGSRRREIGDNARR